MHLHILGICGTFMAGIAVLARALGERVSGADAHAYPPMSEQLAAHGIAVHAGYAPEQLSPAPDCVVVGNALSRGNPCVEYLLNADLEFTSGPAWLAARVLRERHVLAVAGTHGKTTTAAMLTWILDQAGLAPGFLIGGVPGNFGVSARLGGTPGNEARGYFVVEADEYDTAFFDKRSKFVHYRPRTLVLNNLEYDHADIFCDLADIRRQFHHLVRIIPEQGRILQRHGDPELERVMALGCWTPAETFDAHGGNWRAAFEVADGSRFAVHHGNTRVGRIGWPLIGVHNVNNALAAVAAAKHVGVAPVDACRSLCAFLGVKRRLEVRGRVDAITVYDDFAHHPTAIRATVEAMRSHVGDERILAIADPASNTMRLGVHRDTLGPSLQGADLAWVHHPADSHWDVKALEADARIRVRDSVEAILEECAAAVRPGDHVLVMSNSAFGGIHERLLDNLRKRGEG